MIPKGPLYPKKKAFSIILFSITLVIGSATASFFLFKTFYVEKPVKVLVWDNQALPGAILAEMLGLSTNAPSTQSEEVYQARLLAFNTVKKAHAKRQHGGKLFVNYELRQPIAYIGNQSNLAVDAEGILFPYFPFLRPQNLPTLILESVMGTMLSDQECALTRRLLDATASFDVSIIDLSSAFAKSLGSREIVLTLGKEKLTYVRLSPLHFEKQLLNYQRIYKNTSASVVDLRILDCALVKREKS